MVMIKPCHHCRAPAEAKKHVVHKRWNVHCSCGARGPTSITRVGAITLWNVRCKENEKEATDAID